MPLVSGLGLIFCNEKYTTFLVKRSVDDLIIVVMCGTFTIFNQLSKLYRESEKNRTICKISLSGEYFSRENVANNARIVKGEKTI